MVLTDATKIDRLGRRPWPKTRSTYFHALRTYRKKVVYSNSWLSIGRLIKNIAGFGISHPCRLNLLCYQTLF